MRLSILVMIPLQNHRRQPLLEAARGIRSVIVRSMESPRRVALQFQHFLNYDLFIRDWVSDENTQTKPYEDETERIIAWVQEKRLKEVGETEFWVTEIRICLTCVGKITPQPRTL